MLQCCAIHVLFIRRPFSIYREVVLDPVLSDATPRRGELPLAQLTWQRLMAEVQEICFSYICCSMVLVPDCFTLLDYEWIAS